ncbi:DHS-like NAD/FAD-binding domain-containing protein [Rickenella mellea]|uniref:DHS-like NAD/FAD-binding domain-containing protein n=1 Tax=Rickenella mellea TaxID=50990 RepID=A0A4Y7PS62_9AGAM|nr:DHS-like NAD/FAD-binding domain-containing protein [Rickenella mellea]
MTVTVSLSSPTRDASSRRLLSDLSLGVAKSKKIVVVTGAGISCSCGIPDFRSSDGLYNLVKQQYPDVVLKGRDLFDSCLFRDPTSTSLFYTFISQLKESVDKVSPSPTHHFIKTLDTKGKLLRSYTQNIDGLEERVGLVGSSSSEATSKGKGKAKLKLRDVKNVQLHGDIRRVRCSFCSASSAFEDHHCVVFNRGMAPDCPDCTARSQARVARSARPLKIGTLRPAIVLYDEPHPQGDDIGAIQTADLARKPDMLIIMGTSLKVHGLKKLVKEFAKAVQACGAGQRADSGLRGKVIFVNMTPPSSEWDGVIDYYVEGETDAWVELVLDDWRKMRPADWEIQTTLVAGTEKNSGPFKVAKGTTDCKKWIKGSKRKSPKSDQENVPPGQPKIVSKESKYSISPTRATAASPPASPSKRPQVSCHYSDVECSPSKKRSGLKNNAVDRSGIPLDERGLLFKSSKSVNVSVDIDLGAMMSVKAEYASSQKSQRDS